MTICSMHLFRRLVNSFTEHLSKMRIKSDGKRTLRHFYEFCFGRWVAAEEQISFQDFLNWLILHSVEEGFYVLSDSSVSRYLLTKRRFSRLSRIENVIFKNRLEADSEFRQTVTKDSFAFWMRDFGIYEYPSLSLLSRVDTFRSNVDLYKSNPDVVIVSPRNGDSGVGVLASNALKQCEELGLKVSLIQFEFSSYSLSFRAEFYELAKSAKLVIYCISLIEFNYLYYLVGPGTLKVIANKSVYYGPWELKSVPRLLAEALCGVDEIWGISQFASSAFASCYSNVSEIGIAINQDEDYSEKTVDKSGYFQFLTVCASGSYLERKNPLGVIEAFLLAFPIVESSSKLRLRIHVTDVSELNIPTELRNVDERISVTFGLLSQTDYEVMFSSSHCYVSLHRAEGFGIAVAEAIKFGIPVIVSEYGGVLDFCNSDNSYLIGCRLKIIANGSYPYSHGLHWAEPDVAQAARSMIKCATSQFYRKQDNSLSGYTLLVQQRMRTRLIERINLAL